MLNEIYNFDLAFIYYNSSLYIVRPAEAFYRATIQACGAFAWEFKRIWDKEGWEGLDLYRRAFDKFTDGKK